MRTPSYMTALEWDLVQVKLGIKLYKKWLKKTQKIIKETHK